MRKLRVDRIVPIGFLLFVAFILGFMSHDVGAAPFDWHNWVANLQLLPQRLESVGSVSPDEVTGSGPLPLIDTYSSVIDRIKADYYGKEVDERQLTYSAIRGTLHALDDPFTRFMDPDEYKKLREENEGNFSGIGAQLEVNKKGEVFVREVLEGTPAQGAGVKNHDVIVAVDGKSIKGKTLLDVVDVIRGREGTKVKLTLKRIGKPKAFDLTITRRVVPFRMVKSMMVDTKDKIGYVRLTQFNEQSDQQMDEALSKLEGDHMKGLILDLRGNPGGLLTVAIDIGSRFIEKGPVVIIQERGGQKKSVPVEEEKHNHKEYPLVVLVDQSSASASEIVSGAIKDTHSGTLVGTTTFGKGRVQTIMPLQDGSAVAITTAKYLTPNGIDIHKKGIAPDVKVEQPDFDTVLKQMGIKNSDDLDPADPKFDVQLTKAVDVMKVKMGLLPQSVLDKMMMTAKAEK